MRGRSRKGRRLYPFASRCQFVARGGQARCPFQRGGIRPRGNTATVNAFTSNPSGTGTIPSGGDILVDIGATLVLSAGQAAGSYSGEFDAFFDGIQGKMISVLATVAVPISISAGGNMDFCTMSPTGTAGTVTVTPAGARSSVNVDLFGGTPAAASFNMTGEPGQTYFITLPSSTTLTSGGSTMTVDTFTEDGGANPTLVGGSDTFIVGVTLNVGATQASGTYSGTFAVTVNYNYTTIATAPPCASACAPRVASPMARGSPPRGPGPPGCPGEGNPLLEFSGLALVR